MIGVSYDTFWEMNPKSFGAVAKALVLKRDYEDTLLWTLGIYIKEAVSSCLSKHKYPDVPYSKKGSVDRQEKIKNKFLSQMAIINSRLK